MLIGEAGQNFPNTEKFSYTSDRTLLDFDCLILDIQYIFGDTKMYFTNVEKRQNDLVDFIKHKATPIIVISPSKSRFAITRSNGHSVLASIEELLPGLDFDLINEQGKFFEIKSGTPYSNLLNKHKNIFSYKSIFTRINGETLLETRHTKKIVSYYNKNYVVLPRFSAPPKELNEFYEDLISTLYYSSNKPEYILPQWVADYNLPGEISITQDIRKSGNIIQEQELNIYNNNIKLEQIQQTKQLISGTGKPLELVVERAFEEIGFVIEPSVQGRDDLIIKYNDQIAVVEIKGVTGSSAEKHAAQLEKWVANYFDSNEIHAKGILVVNAFKDFPLTERLQPVFPNQMLSYSKSRNHCLLSSVQLLCIYLHIHQFPEEKELIIKSLFSCNGEFDDFKNWQNYFEMT